ncbi:MAG: hypothetical protein PHR16_02725 [Methylovulum sp.]|nr:hypothetical protein [Methylovulum sp.]
MTLYALGYNELEPELIIDENPVIRINLAPFLPFDNERESVRRLRLALAALEQNNLNEEDIIVTSFEPLNADLRAALIRKKNFSYENYDRISKLITVFGHYFRQKPFRKRAWIACQAQQITQWEAKFYGRYGNVELRAIDSYLRNQPKIGVELAKIVDHLADENYMYQGSDGVHWLSAADVNFNLRRLMTNAGFYLPDSPAKLGSEALCFWAREYLDALADTHFLFPYPSCYPNFFVPQDHLFKQQGVIKDYVAFPEPEKFYALLENQNILLMTPFHQEINGLYTSKRLFNLYADIAIPDFTLTTVPAYISTYPNRPHASWNDTFQQLITEVDRAFANNSFSIFFASCGCYGMPICRYVFNRYGCTSVYIGNQVNKLFGILQQCSETFMHGRRINENWSTGNLTQFKNIGKIDGGRYI